MTAFSLFAVTSNQSKLFWPLQSLFWFLSACSSFLAPIIYNQNKFYFVIIDSLKPFWRMCGQTFPIFRIKKDDVIFSWLDDHYEASINRAAVRITAQW